MIKNTMSKMNALMVCLLTALCLASPVMSQKATLSATTPGDVTFTAKGVVPEPPLFFTTDVTAKVKVTATRITQDIPMTLKIIQGRPELMTLELIGEGKVSSVTGASLVDWGVRTSADGKKRYLDIKATYQEGAPKLRVLKMLVQVEHEIESLPAVVPLMTVNPGKAAGFSSRIEVSVAGVDARVAKVSGLLPLEDDWQFAASGRHALSLRLYPSGAAPADVELRGVRLSGSVDASSGSARFILTATAQVSEADGGTLDFLSGKVAVSTLQSDADYDLNLVTSPKGSRYQMEFDRAGQFPVRLELIAKVDQEHKTWPGWYTIDFFAPLGAVIPLELSAAGTGGDIVFAENQPVLLRSVSDGQAPVWRGFLPASGHCLIAWKKGRKAGDGKLAFTSKGLTDVTVGAGLMRQTSELNLKILQGKLNQLSLRMQGPGEVLAVEGTHIAGWSVEDAAGGERMLKIRLSLPLEHAGVIRVRSQQALDQFPVTATPLQLTPSGVLRHSGYVRLSNAGAVRLGTAELKGLMQLSPNQYPAAALKARQVFVFRYPSDEYGWKVHADQILPEVSLTQVVVYQQTESDRVIHSSVELDIREAPLREWELRIPDGFAVASLTGAAVADYVIGAQVENGMRDIKVLFKQAVSGRQLVKLRLEKNAPPVEGVWQLPELVFPGAKSVRGQLGVAAAAGWRVVPGDLDKLTETPLSFFPLKDPDLQQSYRLRETGWSASMKIEAREQSVQADVFHLYSLKEGMAYGSVLLNYFVVGAPVTQWELAIPESYGNLSIEGQNVRQWRRVGDKVVVQLEQPISGAATLLVSFENAMSARGGRLSLGEVRPLNVQSESGFIEVVSPVLLKHKVTASSPGLLAVGADELPAEFRMLTTAPAQAAWQYAVRPFELSIDIAWFEPGKTLEQVVDFAQLKSRVSRDGQVKTEAEFYVRTRGRQALRMELPEGSKLWEARANGEKISARRDGAQYLLPLPVGDDPNKPVKVVVRYGGVGSESSGSKVSLGTPTLAAPVIIAGWQVKGERGRMLIPVEGEAGVRTPPMTETGFESLQGRGGMLLLIAMALLAGVVCLRREKPNLWSQLLAAILLLLAMGISASLAKEVWAERRVNQAVLEMTAQVVRPEAPVTVVVKNIAPWKAMVSWLGIVAAGFGSLALLASWVISSLGRFWLRGLAVAAIAGGILAQRGGGAVFLYTLAGLAAVLLALSLIRSVKQGSQWNARRRDQLRRQREEAAEAVSLGAADHAVKLLVLGLGLFGWLSLGEVAAQTRSIDAMEQSWKIEKNRLTATVSISLNGRQGVSHLLLNEPAVLTSFSGEGLRVKKIQQNGKNVWMLAADRDGRLSGTMTYEMALPAKRARFSLPTGSASVQKVSAELDEKGLELYSEAAVQTQRSGQGVEMVLAPMSPIMMGVRAQGRDIDAEQSKFYAEVANLYLPSPGVVDGVHRLTVRPSSGKVDHLKLKVPDGFTVGEVAGAVVGNWRFDPLSRQLSVEIQPAQSREFSLRVETQRGLEALPSEVQLSSLSVEEDAGEVNMLGLAFGDEAQPGKIVVDQLAVVNVDDFDAALIPAVRNGKGQASPLGILHKVYRSNSGTGSLSVQVAPVMPEVRVVSSQELSLGSERILLSSVLDATITRAGIFKLSFEVPAGMEVESLSGPALSHWTESDRTAEEGAAAKRVVTMHLNGRTLGKQQFALTLTGRPVASQGEWQVPRVQLNEAVRYSGQLLVIPEKGIRVRAIQRNNVSRLNAQVSAQINARVKQSGGLAFRLLQSDWSLSLGIEKLEAWITASVLHEVTLREGQTRTRLSAIYQIEHAAVHAIRVKLPGLSEDEARTVRASGSAVKGIAKLEQDDLWEIRFRRGILGRAPVQIEYQRGADRGQGGSESILPVSFEQAKRLSYFMAVRSTGRLDMQAATPANGWRRSDWAAVSSNLRNPADTSMPDLCYRLSEPEGSLKVDLKRHQMANTLKLRVAGGHMMTVFSPHGESLTSVRLDAQVQEKTELKVTLPEQAVLYNVLVNGVSTLVVREGDTHLFHVSPRSSDDGSAGISLVYSTPPQKGDIQLTAPSFNVPLESLAWDVLVPEGYRLNGYDGGFDLRGSQGVVDYTLRDYLSLINQRRDQEAQQGVVSLQKANDYIKAGKRKEAAKEFEKVTRNRSVDAASNEDARVKLHQLQVQQATWGLNSRRQRIYLDNKAAGNGVQANLALEDSAYNNPLFQGKQEFDVRQVDDFLRGNTQEEKKALKTIAQRLIGQQLATEPAPQTISTIVRGRGEVLRFTRGIQVDGGGSLGLELDVNSVHGVRTGWSLMLLLGTGLVGAAALKRKV